MPKFYIYLKKHFTEMYNKCDFFRQEVKIIEAKNKEEIVENLDLLCEAETFKISEAVIFPFESGTIVNIEKEKEKQQLNKDLKEFERLKNKLSK